MSSFTYNALTREGQEVEGVVSASTRQEALSKLRREGYTPTKIKDKTLIKTRPLSLKIKKGESTAIVRQLSGLMEGGLPLYKGLTILTDRYRDKRIKSIIEEISEEVKKGSPLSESFSAHPGIFPKLLVSMARAGEAGGALEKALGRYAAYAEREEDLKNRLGTMMVYPFLMAVTITGTIFFLLTFVIPRLVLIYEELEQILPLPTRILIVASNFTGRFWWAILISALLFIIGIRGYLATSQGRVSFDRLKLKTPLLGEILNKLLFSRLALALGTLIQSGVPILEALSLGKEAVDNEYLSSKLADLHQGVKEGKGMAGPLMEDPIFPDQFSQMVAVGEESGNLEEMLLKVSNIYDREVENSLKRLTTLLEPLMVILMGLVVGFVVVAMLLPLFSIKLFLE